MHNSSQSVQGTNLLQLPAFHRLQCFGTLAIGLDDYATQICKSDTPGSSEFWCSLRFFVVDGQLLQCLDASDGSKFFV
jgi:hypothetical protein